MTAGTVIHSFASPAALPSAIAWDGQSLWTSDTGTDIIYNINPDDGTIIDSFAAPFTAPSSLACDGRTLWLLDPNADLIYQIDMDSGAVITSFPAVGINDVGIAFDGTFLWIGITLAASVSKLSTSGVVITTLATPLIQPVGIALTGDGRLFISFTGNTIIRMNPLTLAVDLTFATPGSPRGIAWNGSNLWVSNFSDDTIELLSIN